MSIKTVKICPLGSKCEEIKDGEIHQCTWFITLAGKNPTSGELMDEKGCAMSWVPILLIENSQQQRSTSVAIESFRNEVASTNNSALNSGAHILKAITSSISMKNISR